MKKSLVTALAATGFMVAAMILVVKKGPIGAGIILVGLSLLLFVVSALTGIFSDGKKVQGRDRHP